MERLLRQNANRLPTQRAERPVLMKFPNSKLQCSPYSRILTSIWEMTTHRRECGDWRDPLSRGGTEERDKEARWGRHGWGRDSKKQHGDRTKERDSCQGMGFFIVREEGKISHPPRHRKETTISFSVWMAQWCRWEQQEKWRALGEVSRTLE